MHPDALTHVFSILFVVALAGIVYPFKPFGKRSRAVFAAIGCFIGVAVTMPPINSQDVPSAEKQEAPLTTSKAKLWVTSDRLNRRTCPSPSCGVVGQLFFREGATALETRDGWARISEPYSANCVEGRSEFVDTGNAECVEQNGIIGGQFAEWVSLEHLSKDRPVDPAAQLAGIEAMIGQWDDFRLHKDAFVTAAKALIDRGSCKASDFREIGGWVKSTSHGSKPVYFTYCGGVTAASRIYLDVSTGRTFR